LEPGATVVEKMKKKQKRKAEESNQPAEEGGETKKKKKKNKPGKKRRLAMRAAKLARGEIEPTDDVAAESTTAGAAEGETEDRGEGKHKKGKRMRRKRKGEFRTVTQQESDMKGVDATSFSTVMCSGLNFEATEEDLRKFFDDMCDNIEGISIPLYKDGPRNRGVAFVRFNSPEAMQEAIDQLNGKELMGRYLDLKVSTAKKTTGDTSHFAKALSQKPEMCRTVGVFNLRWATTEEELAGHFQECGEVFAARVVSKNGRPQGFGFVEFVGMDSVDKAVKLTGSSIGGRPIRVDYAENLDS